MNDIYARAERRSWTCALVNFAGVNGTGVLVAPDLVLTNYHVIEKLHRGLAPHDQAIVRFDYLKEGVPGLEAMLTPSWLVAYSRYSQRDLDGTTLPEPDKLDYAIIRLTKKIGDEPLPPGNPAGWPGGEEPPRRGWLVLPAPESRPSANTRIDLYHHPCGSSAQGKFGSLPQTYTSGTISKIDSGWLRVTHDAETRHGSSGSICYGNSLEPLALHHAGDPESELGKLRPNQKALPPGQRAIPLGAITGHLFREYRAVHEEMQPAKSAAPTTLLVNSTDATLAAILAKRHDRAMVVLDRKSPEWDIIDSRKSRGGMVHAIACRSLDGHRFFVTRLRMASLAFEMLDEEGVKAKIANCLAAGWSGNSWHFDSLELDTRCAPAAAAEKTVRQMQRKLVAKPGTVFVVEQTFENFDAEWQRRAVREVGRLCAALETTPQAGVPVRRDGIPIFQILFVYHDRDAGKGRDKTRNARIDVAKFWKEPWPPGCGQCLDLGNLDSAELNDWISAIARAYRIDSRDDLTRAVAAALGDGATDGSDLVASDGNELQLTGGQQWPFAALESKLKLVTERFCRDAR